MHEEELNYHFKGVSLPLSAYIPAAATSNLQIKGTVYHVDDGGSKRSNSILFSSIFFQLLKYVLHHFKDKESLVGSNLSV